MSIISALPNTFTNGTTADATAVNANFAQIVANVNANAAASGANADITALTNLATIGHALSCSSTLGVTGLITATGGVAGAVTGNVTGNCSGTAGSLATGTQTYNDGTTSAEIGWKTVPLNTQSGAYQLALTDAGKCINCTNAGAQAITIPANASIAFPVGTVITLLNAGTTAVSVAITSDTLRLAGSSTTGTRTLAQYGWATLFKQAATTWFITGAGVT